MALLSLQTSLPAGCRLAAASPAPPPPRPRQQRCSSRARAAPKAAVASAGAHAGRASSADDAPPQLPRRELLSAAAVLALTAAAPPSHALGAPGLSALGPDGLATYTRPEAKKGNHGIGWGSIDPYSFKVPEGWEEVGGFAGEGYGSQEVDLRFESKTGGRLEVTLAPIRRFIDPVPDKVTIKDIGSELKVIQAFGPEITGGSPVYAEDVVTASVVSGPKGRPYYMYDLKVGGTQNLLVSATVLRDRAFLITLKAPSSLAWRKNKDDMKAIRDSFYVLE